MYYNFLNIIALLCLCNLSSFAQSRIFDEALRTDMNGNSVSYKDSLKLYQQLDGKYMMLYRGYLQPGTLKDSTLSFFYGDYKLIDSTDTSFVFTFKDKKHFFKLAPIPPADSAYLRYKMVTLPSLPLLKVDINMLAKNWYVYKRINRKGPMDIVDENKLIRNLKLSLQDSTVKGSMTNSKGMDRYQVVKYQNAHFIVNYLNTEIPFPIYELSKFELVFEDADGIIYYCRKEK